MSAFITRRGGGGSGGGEVITGTFTPTSTTSVTVPDLIGKSRFVIHALIKGLTTSTVNKKYATGIMFILYADGQIRQRHKNGANMYVNNVEAGTEASEAYFDPDTGTITPSAVSASRLFNTSVTYYYAVFS